MHAYASSTPEARELVSELEFVWDQIKANSNVSSSGSSPRGPVVEESSRTAGTSYASLGGERRRRDEGGGGGGLRVLRPVSDGDEEEEEDFENDEDHPEIGLNAESPLDLSEHPTPYHHSTSRDLDIRNRKWRKRIETGLFRVSTEVAALRELVEAKGVIVGERKNMPGKGSGAWAWVRWLIWAATRQLLADAVVVGLVLMWARKKNERKVEEGLGLVVRAVRERLDGEVEGLRGWRVRSLR